MKCPVCGQRKKILSQEQYGAAPVEVDEPLYQISYPGQKEYLSPRCSDCLEKVLEKRSKKCLYLTTQQPSKPPGPLTR